MTAVRAFARDEAGLVGALAAIVGVLVAGTAGTAGYLYATDYGLKADIEHTDCPLQVVSVKTHSFGIHHDVSGIPLQQCNLLRPGDHVTYHVRSRHTILYSSDGQCVYDSATGAGCGGLPPVSRLSGP
jgi:hypothetical protein